MRGARSKLALRNSLQSGHPGTRGRPDRSTCYLRRAHSIMATIVPVTPRGERT
jgi:hypothetical protein